MILAFLGLVLLETFAFLTIYFILYFFMSYATLKNNKKNLSFLQILLKCCSKWRNTFFVVVVSFYNIWRICLARDNIGMLYFYFWWSSRYVTRVLLILNKCAWKKWDKCWKYLLIVKKKNSWNSLYYCVGIIQTKRKVYKEWLVFIPHKRNEDFFWIYIFRT